MQTSNLWVVSVVSNPVRFRSRYELYRAYAERIKRAGANLLTVELQLGDRGHQVTNTQTTGGCERHVRLWGRDEIWHKENMINLGVQYLPTSWEYLAWLDADIEFVRPDWVSEIIHQLQHFKVIQVFRDAIDLGPEGQFIQKHNGFAWSHVTGQPRGGKGYKHPHWHPGFGWACDRQTFNDLGGLFDVGILGSGDHHMAWALVGKVLENAPNFITPGYKRALTVWQDRANTHVRGDVGYMPGLILHHWHGKKVDRRYGDRWEILRKHNYDPDYDLQRDWQGLYQFSDKGLRMRDDIRAYFRARNEDSIDVTNPEG